MSGAESIASGGYTASGEIYRPQRTVPAERRLGFGRKTLKAFALGATLLAVHGIADYKADVDEVKQMLANTHPYITEYSAPPHEVLEAPTIPHGVYETMNTTERSYVDYLDAASHTALINVSGLGKRENQDPQKFLKGLDSLGYGWTLHYDSTGVDTTVIAQDIIDKARNDPRGIDRLAFYGDSMGTIVATKVAAEITRLAPDLDIPFIILDTPAVNKQAVRDESMDEGYALLDVMRHIPGAEYSRRLRALAQLSLRRQQIFDDPLSFFDVKREIDKQIYDNGELQANVFYAEQFQMIVNADVGGDMKTIAQASHGHPTQIFVTGAANPKRDDVLNTPIAFRLVRQYAQEAGLPEMQLSGIEDFYHGDQARTRKETKEYQRIFRDEVVPQVTANDADEAAD